jgi:peptidoglycan/xylan/chitin deacetylase (PgdA/CDA1 family)
MKFLAAILFCLFSLSVQANQSIAVLMYHQINDSKPASETVVGTSKFRSQLAWLKSEGYTTVTASELAAFMRGELVLPPKSIAITFDDGWKDIVQAGEWLKKAQMSATFYVMSGTFNDPRYVNAEDIRRLASDRLFEIGSHSHTHFLEWESDLSKLDERIIIAETLMSKSILEKVLGRQVRSIAWPYGHHTAETLRYAEMIGYTSTMTVNSESANKVGDRTMEIKRVTVDGRCSIAEFKSLVETKTLATCR